MNLNSIEFPILVFGIVVLYWTIKRQWRWPLLLVVSYLFYAWYSPAYSLLLLVMTLIAYGFGHLLESHRTKGLLALAIVLNFVPLVFFKGVTWWESGWNLVVPMGLSYYSFKVVGYLVDIFRGNARAEHNVGKFALFVSFFPEIVIGPIDRAENLLSQINTMPVFDFMKIKKGVLLMAYGYFEKMVIADRIGLLVNAVYEDLESYVGAQVLTAVLLYSMQIYMDFAGCTNIVRGVGLALGFEMPENFRQPYLAQSVAEFWRGWHMSLTGWFREYVYIPLGGNRKGNVRKYLNIMIVFTLSGLWHGNGLSFILWGMLNAMFQVIGTITTPIRKKIYQLLRMDENNVWVRVWKCGVTYFLISITWIFFRAESIKQGLEVIQRMFLKWNIWVLVTGDAYEFAFDNKNWYLLLFCLFLVFLIDFYQKNKKCRIEETVLRQNFLVQLVVVYLLMFACIIYGVYGTGFDAGSFIYMNF